MSGRSREATASTAAPKCASTRREWRRPLRRSPGAPAGALRRGWRRRSPARRTPPAWLRTTVRDKAGRGGREASDAELCDATPEVVPARFARGRGAPAAARRPPRAPRLRALMGRGPPPCGARGARRRARRPPWLPAPPPARPGPRSRRRTQPAQRRASARTSRWAARTTASRSSVPRQRAPAPLLRPPCGSAPRRTG